MKIVSITPDIDSGGSAKSLYVLSRYIIKRGHSLHIISIAQPSHTKRKVEELRSFGAEISFFNIPYFPLKLIACPIPFWKNVWRSLSQFNEFKRLKAAVKQIAPDVVHYNSYTTLHISAFLEGFPAVLHAREVLVEPSVMVPVVKNILRLRIQEIIAISPEEGEQAKRLFSLPVKIVFNSPSIPMQFTPLPSGNRIVYGVFSNITPSKGQWELVQACIMAAEKLRKANVQIRIFGGAVGIHKDYYNSLNDVIKDKSISDIITVEGFTDHPEIEMLRSHLIVRPDATGQPWGRDIIESMSIGRPVLATGDSRAFVHPGINGMLVPPCNVKALANALVEMADLKLLSKMGKSAYNFACKNFDPEINLGKVTECMEKIA